MPVLAIARFIEWSVTSRCLALVLVASVAAEGHTIGIYTAVPLSVGLDEGRRERKADSGCCNGGEKDFPHWVLSITVVPNRRKNLFTRGLSDLSLPKY